MNLLQLRFVMAYSETLKRTIFFAEDEAVQYGLILDGADASAIYTLEEIEALAKHNRESLITGKELCLLHEAKTLFGGRFTDCWEGARCAIFVICSFSDNDRLNA